MVDAEHRLLELGVEDAAVGDDDHAVEDAPVPRVVQPRQAVREPGDRVRLARPGRVLDEVVAPRPMRPRVRHQRGDGVELVVAREDHRLLHAQLACVVPLLLAVEEEEAVQDVEPAVLGPDLLPQVGGTVARGVVGVAGPAVAAAVEGQEARGAARQLRGHEHVRGVGGEVHERAGLEGEDRVLGGAVLAVLAHRVPHRLAGEGVLQLGRGRGDAVERQHEVEALRGIARAVVHLPRHLEDVGGVAGLGVGVQPGVGAEVGEADGAHRHVPEALAQEVERAVLGPRLRDPVENAGLGLRAVGAAQGVPGVGLGRLDEADDGGGA